MAKQKKKRSRVRALWREVCRYGAYLRFFADNHKVGLLLVALFAVTLAWLSQWLVVTPTYRHVHNGSRTSGQHEVFSEIPPEVYWYQRQSAGILFTATMAVVTMAGFIAGLAKLEEALARVTSLEAFLRRAAILLDGAVGEVHIVCYSPLIGSISAPTTGPERTFRKMLLEVARSNDVALEIVGLPPSALRAYHKRYEQRGFSETVCASAYKDATEFIRQLTTNFVERSAYYALGDDQKPNFILVTTDDEAIIASVLFDPSAGEPGSASAPADRSTTGRARRVELIGFATRDKVTLDEIGEAFQFLKTSAEQVTEAIATDVPAY